MNSQYDECERFQLAKAVEQTLDDAAERRLTEHLGNCRECRERLAEFAGDDAFWARAATNLAASARFNAESESPSRSAPALHSSVFVRIDPDAPQLAEVSSVRALATDSEPPFDPPTHPEMLGRVDGFSIERIIGRGGMGVVYKGFDAELNRPVAIKFLAPHLSISGVARKRFAREAQAAAAVVHPNVVPIYSIGSSEKRPFIVMALVSGRSLQNHVEENGPLPAEDVVRIAQQIAAGLSAAHEQGLVHRDIKPANIMLEKEVSRVMITDFGLARAADDAGMTQSGWLAGTPHYMSPEQTKGDDVGHQSDLFSLASVMYFMATGREPFRAENPYAVLQKIGSEMPASARSINSSIPVTLDNVIAKLHAKNPKDRYESASTVQEVLTQYLAHLQNPTQHSKPKVAGASRVGWLPKAVIGGAVGIIACITAVSVGSLMFPAKPKSTPIPEPISLAAPPPIVESQPEIQPEINVTPGWLVDSPESQRWDAAMSELRESVQRMEQPVKSSEYSPDSFEDEKAALQDRIREMQRSLGM